MSTQKEQSAGIAAASPPEKLEILVVDDQADILNYLKRFLAAMGHSVCPMDSPGDALEELGTGRFDLVLVDLAMPGMTGLEFLEQMRARKIRSRAVLMTGTPSLDAIAAAVGFGIDGLLLKPFALDELQSTLQRIMERRADELVAR